jgi:phosphoglucosamine mutase
MGELFGTDGIRGNAGTWPITTDFFYKIGLAAGYVLSEGTSNTHILIGRDTRASGEELQDALVSGMISSGLSVIDSGVITTPAVSMLIKKQNISAGAVISASHNPVEQNGVKFFNRSGDKLSDSQEEKIESFLFRNNLIESYNRKGRLIDGHDYSSLYTHSLIEEHPNNFLHGIKILVDCSNGAASALAPEVFRRLGAEIFSINSNPDGLNINKNCGSEYTRRHPDLISKDINKVDASFGIAFDGDADRVVFVNNLGELIDGDHILGLLAGYLSKKGVLLDNSVVATIMRNEGLSIYMESLGLKLIETPVGDKYVVQALKNISKNSDGNNKIGLGGEQAGHVILMNQNFTTGDGIRTALHVMRAFIETGKKSFADFSSLFQKTPQVISSAYVGGGERFDREDLDRMQEQELSINKELSRLVLRYSGTEPIFRVMIESNYSMAINDLAQISVKFCMRAQEYAGVPGGKIDILNCQSGGQIEFLD